MIPHRAAGRPARILIVDDDENNRTLLEVMLAPEGFELDTARSGELALELIAREPPDLVLLDVLMPGMGGYEVAAILKSDLATKHIPIIMITALDDRDARLDGLRAGAEDFLTRPLDHIELAMRVRNLLRLKVGSDGAIAERDTSMGMVNHDLRNLLNNVVLEATLLGTDAPPRIAAGLQRMLGYAARMARLVDDLVDLASFDAGRVSIVAAHEDAVALIAETVATATQAAAKLGLTIRSELAEPTLEATFDRERILQVLSNLVTNALKFTARGGTVTVRGKRTAGGLRLSVRDTGMGIPSDQLETVFERFTQLKEHDGRGVGLGLYISRCIVHSHGGRMWVDSTLGKGSTFYFTIPSTSPSRSPSAVPPATSSPREAVARPQSAPPARVLIVDDDPAMGETLALFLNRGGFAATARASAKEALVLLEANGFDVLVTDLNMDDMTGLALCARVATIRPGLPVILTSGFGNLDARAAAHDAGAYAFLAKPIDLELLRVTLDRALNP